MMLSIKKNTVIFIENDMIFQDGFEKVLENILEVNKKYNIMIYLDKDVRSRAETLLKTDEVKNAIQLAGLVDIIQSKLDYEFVDTKNYFDISDLSIQLNSYKNYDVSFLLHSDLVYNVFSAIKEDIKNCVFYKFENTKWVKWKSKQSLIRGAFNVDDYEMNKPAVDEIMYVYSPKFGYLPLDKTLVVSGGEGSIYRTYNGYMAKIYNDEHITYSNMKKIQLMIDTDVFNPHIAWPIDILYYQGDFVGYLMKEIENTISLDMLRLDGFQQISVYDRYVLALNFLKVVNYLHKKDIVVGDMKLDNILIELPSKVFLIDCGTYQIMDYPCVVCHPEYTKKDYTKTELRTLLRAVDDEYYPINKIVFQILIGKNPNYNSQNPEVNIEDKNGFYYPIKIPKSKKLSFDMQLWSVVPEKMREMFYYYFKQDKVSYLEEWIDEFTIFIADLDKQRVQN